MTETNKNGSRRRYSFDDEWARAALLVTTKRLRGLTVRCPACGRRGTAFSKWEKGAREKPLFLCHIGRGGGLETCRLDPEQAACVRRKLRFFADDVTKLIRLGRPIALFSGGKDSLCLVSRISELAKAANRQLTAIHADTTAGFPEVESYVQNVCDRLQVPLTVVRPHRDFFETAKSWGIPSPRSRWCCKTLKVAPMRRHLRKIEGPKVIFDGIRAAESSNRAKYTPVWYHPTFRCISVSPMFYWSDEQIMRYIRRKALPESPAVKFNTSAECWCGAYQGREDFEALLGAHPEIFDKLVDVEKAQKGKYTFLFENGQRIPLVQLKPMSKRPPGGP
jgi:3'-phosphoadenosine 5'-phosphosulfate sulfotransferase (PAPS reductase)/FAD synthetase